MNLTDENRFDGTGLASTLIRESVAYNGDGCLFWPFTRDTSGYGMLGCNGGVTRAHRVMCEMVHGPAPSPRHVAAHECGNGHLGCFHPKHLFWRTPEENTRDAVRHGALKGRAGERRAKLTPAQVVKIKSLKGTAPQPEIAAQFGVARETIGKIWRGELWASKLGATRNRIPDRGAAIANSLRLRRQGISHAKIAKALGVSRATVRTLLAEGSA